MKSTGPASSAHKRAESALRDIALAYPETHEDFPWGHSAFKVKKKVFLFLGNDHEGFGLSVKLPDSHVAALDLAFTQPTPYGLGKSGWVSATFGPRDDVPLELLRKWIDESYRAIAPKKIVAQLAAGAGAPRATAEKKSKPAAKKKVAKSSKRTAK